MSDEVTRFPAPFIVVKVHAQGLEWWEAQGMPQTMTIGCRTLEQREGWRTYAQPRDGKHFIYEAAEGFAWPSVEYDTFIDTMHYWTRLPPDPTKFWIDFLEPAVIDWFPDPTPLRDLALDIGPKKEAASRSG